MSCFTIIRRYCCNADVKPIASSSPAVKPRSEKRSRSSARLSFPTLHNLCLGEPATDEWKVCGTAYLFIAMYV